MEFKDLKLVQPIMKAVADEGYVTPSPIQAQAIPPALEGKDVLGCAQTGTGKTAAFALPMIQRLSMAQRRKPGSIGALVLTPTRELAIQIEESFRIYGRHVRLKYAVIFGGVSQVPQVNRLAGGVDVLIATPGRLLDLESQGVLNLNTVQIFVLDEADRMLDMGFIRDVRKIIALLPKKRQTLFFSATMPPEVADIAEAILTDPVKVAVTPVSSTVDAIRQGMYFVDKGNKIHLLAELLGDKDVVSALVFSRTKHGADKIAKSLAKKGITALAIHGDKAQSARQTALNRFKAGDIRVLVATDIAARGIDIDELSHVFNYDLPEPPETYVHRIGRTGRAGLGGIALSFCCIDEMKKLREIEKLIGRKVEEITGHAYPMEIMEPSPPKQPTPRRPRQQADSPRREKQQAVPHSEKKMSAEVQKPRRPKARRRPKDSAPRQNDK